MNKFLNLWKFTNDFQNHADFPLRDYLAIARTKLANERTLFSYIRTSLYLLTAGIGILELDSVEHLYIVAYLSLLFSGLLFFIGLLRFWRLRKYLSKDLPKISSSGEITKNKQAEHL